MQAQIHSPTAAAASRRRLIAWCWYGRRASMSASRSRAAPATAQPSAGRQPAPVAGGACSHYRWRHFFENDVTTLGVIASGTCWPRRRPVEGEYSATSTRTKYEASAYQPAAGYVAKGCVRPPPAMVLFTARARNRNVGSACPCKTAMQNRFTVENANSA